MPKFVLIYHGGRKPETPEEGAEGMAKWKQWAMELGDAIVEPGVPMGMSKTVSKDGVTDDGGPNPVTGYTIVEAGDMDAALEMAKSCPFLDMDGTLEVAQAMEMQM